MPRNQPWAVMVDSFFWRDPEDTWNAECRAKLGVPTIMENQMEKRMENEMETGIIERVIGIRVSQK